MRPLSTQEGRGYVMIALDVSDAYLTVDQQIYMCERVD